MLAGALVVLGRILVPYVRILLAAWRLELRDKGYVQTDSDGMVSIHTHCNTRLRIGITKQKSPVWYCWRCECLISGPGDGPKGRDDIPEPQAPVQTKLVDGDNLVHFPGRRKSA